MVPQCTKSKYFLFEWDAHVQQHLRPEVFQSLFPSFWCCVAFAMSSPDSPSTSGGRGKARYMSPTMAVIRMQKDHMTKTLKTLRKDMRKELQVIIHIVAKCLAMVKLCLLQFQHGCMLQIFV